MAACLEWATERVEECNETRDQGYSECDDWRSQCCDWPPCSWACEFVSWVCFGWRWVEDIVCVGWTVITTTVCVLWDVGTTLLNGLLVTLESLLGWVLSGLLVIVEALEMIPGFGTFLRWLLNGVTFLVWTLVSVNDFLGGLIGIRPEKILRVCAVILRDENDDPVTTVDNMVAVLQEACNIYKRDANVRIVRSGPFQYASGFFGAETVTKDWVTIASGASDSDMLDPPCDVSGEWWLGGTKFQVAVTANCFYGAWRRVLGYGAPITIFAVHDVQEAGGCSFVITDFVTVEAGSATRPPDAANVAGHELGHSCNLWHICVDDEPSNMMASGDGCSPIVRTLPNFDSTFMAEWQVLLVRASKHVTYF